MVSSIRQALLKVDAFPPQQGLVPCTEYFGAAGYFKHHLRYNRGMNHTNAILEKLNNLPPTPGVYHFLGNDGETLYVGMSRCLRDRVRSYFYGAKEGKIGRMVHQIQDLTIEHCDTQLEARLLECRRIKEIRPPYNAQFKREKGIVYLKVRQNSGASLAISFDSADGIGPFRSRRLAETVIEEFPKLFPLRISTTKEAKKIQFTFSFLPKRITTEEFQTNREALELLFYDRMLWTGFIQDLEQAMLKAAEAQRFAEAAFYRDFCETLRELHRHWFDYQSLLDQVIFLRIPVGDGVKYFRVSSGLISDTGKGKDFAGKDFKTFCRKKDQGPDPIWGAFSEKACFDFRNILYSEISSMPEDQVVTAEEAWSF